jgi:phosphoglycerol transferase MdoB-like AlkP superfamily enzyme
MHRFPFRRLKPVTASILLYTALGSLLRAILAFTYHPSSPVGWSKYAAVLVSGLHQDLTVATLLFTPMAILLLLFQGKPGTRPRWRGVVWNAATGLTWLVLILLFVAEFTFFDEFQSRFNTVAIDYLIYPHEVVGNMDQSYPLGWIAAGVLASTVLVMVLLRRCRGSNPNPPMRWTERWKWAACWIGLAGLVGASAAVIPHPEGGERLIDELAANGLITGARAALTRNLDYAAFYPTLPPDEARALVHEMVALPGDMFFTADAGELRRHIPGDSARPKLNVCLLLEESLGSEFWGSLGRKKRDGTPSTLTPHLDKFAAKSGMLFTNLYADGNRTIRGFEGVFASFPPLPGDSIVARDRSEDVETIGKVLKRDGYQSVFLYGGNSLFDGMGRFLKNNGWDRCIEEKDFTDPVFTTAWGVSNEDLYGRALREMRALHATGQPFLMTTLSVSNHRPYTYPAGRIKENPLEKRRDFAVKYTDWALGEFFRRAKHEPFWKDTIFVVVADHGARVYGSEKIPIHSYEIPMLVAGPAVVDKPSRIDTLGCQLDVAPTILGLIGRPYDSMFFGRDLRRIVPDTGRVFLNHNREIAGFSGQEMVVFSLNKKMEGYFGNPKEGAMRPCPPSELGSLESLIRRTTAFYQVADDLYMNRRYSFARYAPESRKAP